MLNLRDGSEEWRWWTFFPDWRDPLADEPDYSYEPLEERSEGVELSSLPAEVTAAVGGGETVADRWVFLLVKCGRTKDLYLVRYRKEIEKRDCFGSGRSIYNVAAADPLDDFDVDGEGMKITVSTEQLHGILPCPHCKNAAWGRCHCSRLFSMPLQAGKLTRPWCGKADDYGDNGSGDVSGGGRGIGQMLMRRIPVYFLAVFCSSARAQCMQAIQCFRSERKVILPLSSAPAY